MAVVPPDPAEISTMAAASASVDLIARDCRVRSRGAPAFCGRSRLRSRCFDEDQAGLQCPSGRGSSPIGPATSVLYIAREITSRTFAIGGGTPGQKVCWIVTGVRQDAWAQKHPLRVERTKKPKDRGKYLNPEAFGKPRKAAIRNLPMPKLRTAAGTESGGVAPRTLRR